MKTKHTTFAVVFSYNKSLLKFCWAIITAVFPFFNLPVTAQAPYEFDFQITSLSTPYSVDIDQPGNIYVAEWFGNRFRKFNPAGAELLSFGSLGSGNGQFSNPIEISVAPNSNLFVADPSKIEVHDPTGQFLFRLASSGSNPGQVNRPSAIDFGLDGTVWVADQYNHRIQRFSLSGSFIGSFGSFGDNPGQFNYPQALAVGPDGNIYVTENNKSRIQVFNPGGGLVRIIQSPTAGQPGSFSNVLGIDWDQAGNLYLAEGTNQILVFSYGGAFQFKFGSNGSGPGQFNGAVSVAVARDGSKIYVADSNNSRVQIFRKTLTACTQPNPVFSLANGLINQLITLSDASLNVQVGATYQWQFGDGSTSNTLGTVQHAYTLPGTYTVSLTITQGSCVASTERTIVICELISIQSTPGDQEVCNGGTVTMEIAATGSLLSYEWIKLAASGSPETIVGNESSFTRSDIIAGNGDGGYLVRVFNACESWTSESFYITVAANVTYYADLDGDGFGNPAAFTQECALNSPPQGYVTDNTDFDDRYSWLYPGARCDQDQCTLGVYDSNGNCIRSFKPAGTPCNDGSGIPGSTCDGRGLCMPVMANQTITFNPLPTKTYSDAPFSLTATASSGLPVTYTSSDANVATVSGNIVTILKAGSVTITASQGGNANYLAAADVQQTLTVNKASQTIFFDRLPITTYGTPSFDIKIGASSGLPLSFIVDDPTVATIRLRAIPDLYTVTILNAGTTKITAIQEGNENFLPAESVGQTLTVNKANQTLSVASSSPTDHLVISEIFGGGGVAGAPVGGDYIELYNPTNSPVDVRNMSIQYALKDSWFVTRLDRSKIPIINPGQYLLIAKAIVADVDLPFDISERSGKVALVNVVIPLSGPNPLTTRQQDGVQIIDFVGYGAADAFEGAGPAVELDFTSSIERKASANSTAMSMQKGGNEERNGNAYDSNNNANDFVLQKAPNPQFSGSGLETPVSGTANTNHLVISEIFGGGGFAGAPFGSDYIELYNPTNSPVDVRYMSIQYYSGGVIGGSWIMTKLYSPSAPFIYPGQYFLIARSGLPVSPDVDLPFDISERSGKVALVNVVIPLSGPNPLTTRQQDGVQIIDFVGYGAADAFEGAGPAVELDFTSSIERKASANSTAMSMQKGGNEERNGNAYDSNNNTNDFVLQNAPNPQFSGSGLETPISGTAWTITDKTFGDAPFALDVTSSSGFRFLMPAATPAWHLLPVIW